MRRREGSNGRAGRLALGRLAAILVLAAPAAWSGDVEIVRALFEHRGGNEWQVSVTLRHADAGWDHYADGWRVVAADGTVLGTRILYHPHVGEQPFTRGQSMTIPGAGVVHVDAHDLVHGWSPRRLPVDLAEPSGTGYEVRR